MSDPIEAARGKKIGERVLRQCDRDGFGLFVAMFAAQTILVKCAETARHSKLAKEWNAWLQDTLEKLFLPEAMS